MERQIYKVDLVYYTEENVPECGAEIFISSTKDLREMSVDEIKENIYVQEELERNDCESIGYIEQMSHSEFLAEYNEDLIVF